MAKCLPGIAARWVAAQRAFRTNGGHYTDNPPAVETFLETASSRVGLFLRACCIQNVDATTETELVLQGFAPWDPLPVISEDRRFTVGVSRPKLRTVREAMKMWAAEQGFGVPSEERLLKRLTGIHGVKRVQVGPATKRLTRLNLAILPREQWGESLLGDLGSDNDPTWSTLLNEVQAETNQAPSAPNTEPAPSRFSTPPPIKSTGRYAPQRGFSKGRG